MSLHLTSGVGSSSLVYSAVPQEEIDLSNTDITERPQGSPATGSGAAPITPIASPSLKLGKGYSEGFHFVVKKNGKNIGDLVGSLHEDEEGKGIVRLNPAVEEAARKADVVASEQNFNTEEVFQYLLHRVNSVAKIKKDYVDLYKNYNRDHVDYEYHSHLVKSTEIKKTSKLNGTDTLIDEIRKQGGCFSLETPEEMAEAGNYVDRRSEFLDNMISKGVLSQESITQARNDSIAAYQAGDEATLVQVKKYYKRLDPVAHHHLVKKRNLVQAERAKPLVQKATPDSRVLIVIGSSHLFGKNGVIKLLEKDLGSEYSIERSYPWITPQEIKEFKTSHPNFSCTKPYKLDLSNSSMTDAELKDILAHFPNASEMNVQGCNALTNEGLASLSGLVKITNSTRPDQITEAALQHLKNLPNLQNLALSHGVDDAGQKRGLASSTKPSSDLSLNTDDDEDLYS